MSGCCNSTHAVNRAPVQVTIIIIYVIHEFGNNTFIPEADRQTILLQVGSMFCTLHTSLVLIDNMYCTF